MEGRNLKFRVWLSDLQKFIFIEDGGSERCSHMCMSRQKHNNFTSFVLSSNEKRILQEYVGFDDVNDQGIYEGDIIEFHGTTHGYPNTRDNWVDTVVFRYCGFGVDWMNRRLDELHRIRVIGNIMQNPELLKRKYEM